MAVSGCVVDDALGMISSYCQKQRQHGNLLSFRVMLTNTLHIITHISYIHGER